MAYSEARYFWPRSRPKAEGGRSPTLPRRGRGEAQADSSPSHEVATPFGQQYHTFTLVTRELPYEGKALVSLQALSIPLHTFAYLCIKIRPYRPYRWTKRMSPLSGLGDES